MEIFRSSNAVFLLMNECVEGESTPHRWTKCFPNRFCQHPAAAVHARFDCINGSSTNKFRFLYVNKWTLWSMIRCVDMGRRLNVNKANIDGVNVSNLSYSHWTENLRLCWITCWATSPFASVTVPCKHYLHSHH